MTELKSSCPQTGTGKHKQINVNHNKNMICKLVLIIIVVKFHQMLQEKTRVNDREYGYGQ